MANDVRRDAEPEFKAENEVDLLLGGANPNPTREACPPRGALVSLARRQVPVGDPVGEHVSKCSPCYREMRAIQQAEGIRPADERRPPRTWWPAAAAVLLLAAGLAAWLVYGGGQTAPTRQPARIVANAEPVAVTLDLRKHSVTRSDAPAEDLPPLVLPRAKVTLTLLLPVGSEAGNYEVRVLGSDGGEAASARAGAEIRDFVTTLRTLVDLETVGLGTGSLQLRRSSESWQTFSVRLE